MSISAMMILLNVFFDERNILSIKVPKVDRDSRCDKCHHKHLYWEQSVILDDNSNEAQSSSSLTRGGLFKNPKSR